MDVQRNENDNEVARLFGFAGPRPRLSEAEVAPAREAARAVFRQHVQRRARRRRAVWTAVGSVAASLLAVAGLLWKGSLRPAPDLPLAAFAVRSGEVSLSGGGELTAGAVIATGRDGRAALRLADGGPMLRLAGSSRLKLDTARSLTLSAGAVYVDSREGSGLEITTPVASVTDVGTRFEVRLLEGAVRVRVREGKVRVEHRAERHQALAGDELVVHADGRARRAGIAASGPAWDWIQQAAPPFALEGSTLAAFLDWAARETGRSWQLAGGAAGRVPEETVLHGSIAGLTADEALEVVLPGCGLTARREGDVLWLDEI